MRDFAGVVFHLSMDDGDQERDGWPLLRAERIGAYDGGTLVGQLGTLPMRLAVPGALLDCSAVTFVGVLPTHRRRGILTSMMDRMDADAIAAGRPVAALWASEGVIYGRYGFGLATRAIGLEVDSSRPLDLRTVPDDRPLRLVDTASAPDLLGPIHDRSLAVRPGGLVRDADWWTRGSCGRPTGTPRGTPRRASSTTPPLRGLPGPRGRSGSSTRRRHSAGRGGALAVPGPIDLSSRVVAPNRPVDDLLPHMAADSEQVTVTHGFGALWLRLIDVPPPCAPAPGPPTTPSSWRSATHASRATTDAGALVPPPPAPPPARRPRSGRT